MSTPDDDDSGPGVPEWVVTYGDMMSLLLTFFIMLVSMSSLKDEGNNRAMMDALRRRFGPSQDLLSGVLGRSLQLNSSLKALFSAGQSSEGGVKKASKEAAGDGGANMSVERINHGTVITIGGPAVFQRFSAEVSPSLRKRLDIIARVVAHKPNRLVIRGHATAEALPPDSQFHDPTELSFARAHNTALYLMEQGIDASRIHVSAVGASEPRMLSREKERQSQNRRVDVFVIDSYISASQNPEQSAD